MLQTDLVVLVSAATQLGSRVLKSPLPKNFSTNSTTVQTVVRTAVKWESSVDLIAFLDEICVVAENEMEIVAVSWVSRKACWLGVEELLSNEKWPTMLNEVFQRGLLERTSTLPITLPPRVSVQLWLASMQEELTDLRNITTKCLIMSSKLNPTSAKIAAEALQEELSTGKIVFSMVSTAQLLCLSNILLSHHQLWPSDQRSSRLQVLFNNLTTTHANDLILAISHLSSNVESEYLSLTDSQLSLSHHSFVNEVISILVSWPPERLSAIECLSCFGQDETAQSSSILRGLIKSCIIKPEKAILVAIQLCDNNTDGIWNALAAIATDDQIKVPLQQALVVLHDVLPMTPCLLDQLSSSSLKLPSGFLFDVVYEYHQRLASHRSNDLMTALLRASYTKLCNGQHLHRLDSNQVQIAAKNCSDLDVYFDSLSAVLPIWQKLVKNVKFDPFPLWLAKMFQMLIIPSLNTSKDMDLLIQKESTWIMAAIQACFSSIQSEDEKRQQQLPWKLLGLLCEHADGCNILFKVLIGSFSSTRSLESITFAFARQRLKLALHLKRQEPQSPLMAWLAVPNANAPGVIIAALLDLLQSDDDCLPRVIQEQIGLPSLNDAIETMLLDMMPQLKIDVTGELIRWQSSQIPFAPAALARLSQSSHVPVKVLDNILNQILSSSMSNVIHASALVGVFTAVLPALKRQTLSSTTLKLIALALKNELESDLDVLPSSTKLSDWFEAHLDLFWAGIMTLILQSEAFGCDVMADVMVNLTLALDEDSPSRTKLLIADACYPQLLDVVAQCKRILISMPSCDYLSAQMAALRFLGSLTGTWQSCAAILESEGLKLILDLLEDTQRPSKLLVNASLLLQFLLEAAFNSPSTKLLVIGLVCQDNFIGRIMKTGLRTTIVEDKAQTASRLENILDSLQLLCREKDVIQQVVKPVVMFYQSLQQLYATSSFADLIQEQPKRVGGLLTFMCLPFHQDHQPLQLSQIASEMSLATNELAKVATSKILNNTIKLRPELLCKWFITLIDCLEPHASVISQLKERGFHRLLVRFLTSAKITDPQLQRRIKLIQDAKTLS